MRRAVDVQQVGTLRDVAEHERVGDAERGGLGLSEGRERAVRRGREDEELASKGVAGRSGGEGYCYRGLGRMGECCREGGRGRGGQEGESGG